jgi:hypothetical protein
MPAQSQKKALKNSCFPADAGELSRDTAGDCGRKEFFWPLDEPPLADSSSMLQKEPS